jgi:hypothetical protein
MYGSEGVQTCPYRCEKRVIVMLESGECFGKKGETGKKSERLGE